MCLFPMRASKQEFGKPKFHHEGELLLPCGKCYECQSKRAIEWATRAKHEMSLHRHNSYITLTYNKENLKSQYTFKDEFHLFVRRLRKQQKQPIRYMVSHEYGTENSRPHHHVIFFGYKPKNQKLLKHNKGNPLFTSTDLEKLWKLGFHSIGEANERSAYYIASYALKGKKKQISDQDTGEIIEVSDSMDVSKRPAIGLKYLLAEMDTLIASPLPLPRYYQKILERDYPDKFEEYQNKLTLKIKNRSDNDRYAKFVTKRQQEKISNSEFRENLIENKIRDQQEAQLRYNRDEINRLAN